MGYDRYPELLIDEKKALLTSLAGENAWLFYVHDPEFAVSQVRFDDEQKTYIAVDALKDLAIGSGQ